jgi:hypothetical protein
MEAIVVEARPKPILDSQKRIRVRPVPSEPRSKNVGSRHCRGVLDSCLRLRELVADTK